MGLYLCVFDESEEDEELDGVEVGSYEDFEFFRDAVVQLVEGGEAGSVCPVLVLHSDSDGEWSSQESAALIEELRRIELAFALHPPVEYGSAWKTAVAKQAGIRPRNFLDCFFDVDGEPLVARLVGLAELSKARNLPISFQ